MSITSADIQQLMLVRQKENASNATINRDLSILSRAFTLGVKRNKTLSRPHFEPLKENNVRQGFFE